MDEAILTPNLCAAISLCVLLFAGVGLYAVRRTLRELRANEAVDTGDALALNHRCQRNMEQAQAGVLFLMGSAAFGFIVSIATMVITRLS